MSCPPARPLRRRAVVVAAASVWAVSLTVPLALAQGDVPPRPPAPERYAPPHLDAGPAPARNADEVPGRFPGGTSGEPMYGAPGDSVPGDGARAYGARDYGGGTFDAAVPLPARPGDAQVPGFPEPPEFGRAELPGPPRPGVDALPGTPFFADTEHGARPTPGVPGYPGFGLPHRPEHTNRYGVWYQPKLFHAPNRAVYRPSPFRPRGFGNLFDRPCVPDRMDYTPYTVEDLPSRYGPTYYPHFRENTECLVRPTRCYDRGPHAENSTGGCRLGGDCYQAAGYSDCPGCRPAAFVGANRAGASRMGANRPQPPRNAAGPNCDCARCRAGR